MNLTQHVENYLATNRRRWSSNTAERYRSALETLASDVPGLNETWTADQFLAWLESHGWGSSAQWVAFCAVRGFLTWRYGQQHPAMYLKIRRDDTVPQRSLSLDQVRQLLASFDTSQPAGRRNVAMAGLFLDSALRVSELCSLSLRYMELPNRQFQVKVKGGRWDVRHYSLYTASWIEAWLPDRETIARPGVAELFVGIGGKSPGSAMTRTGVQVIVKRWGKSLGLELSPHDFRRSMGSIATLLGAPEDVTMKGGGWQSHDVFRRYTVGVTSSAMEEYFPTKGAMTY